MLKNKTLRKDFLIAFFLGLIFFFIFFNVVGAQIIDGGIVPCDGPSGDFSGEGSGRECDGAALLELVSNIINFLVIISSSVFVAMMVYAGWLYMSAQGDSGKVGKAHSLFSNSVIGIIIVLCAWLVIKAVLVGIGANSEYQSILSQINNLWIS